MDADQVSLYRLTAYRLAAGALLAAALASSLAGCGGKRRAKKQAPSDPIAAKVKKMEEDVSSITARGTNNSLLVDDEQGRPLLKAQVAKLDGGFKPGQGMQGPVKLHVVKALLFQNGKPQLDLQSEEATWDGKFLSTDKPAHAVMSDTGTVIDAQKAVWTSATGHLALDNAKMQSMKQGKPDFLAEAPKAHLEKQVATMPSGAAAHNPQGQQLQANTMRWNMTNGRLEANGDVVVKDAGTQVYGQHLTSDTKLRKGRLTGGTRIKMQKMPVKMKNG